MAKVSRILVYVALMTVIVPLFFIGACVVKAKRYESGFARVAVGDSKQKVIDLLGEPSEVEGCYADEKCADVFVYYSFMERRGFIFDNGGKVINKYYNVSH